MGTLTLTLRVEVRLCLGEREYALLKSLVAALSADPQAIQAQIERLDQATEKLKQAEQAQGGP